MQIKKKFVDLTTGTSGVNGQGVIANYPSPTNYTPTQVSAEGTDKISAYFKGIDTALGSASQPSPVVNFLTLDTTFVPSLANNFNFESSIGNWVTYADAAGVLPVDMTGGSPTITLSRTTTSGEVLDGIASAKLVKGASNVQGQGISCVANVPLGYRGTVTSIQFPFKVLSGTIIDGDIRFYIYDITNAQIITPSNNYCTVSGQMKMTFPMPTNTTQIRVGLHFASTSATAVTYAIDDVVVGPQSVVYGGVMSQWIPYTVNITGSVSNPSKGTIAWDAGYYRIIGDSMEIMYAFQQSSAGSAGSGGYLFSLPTGYTINTSLIPGVGDPNSNIMGDAEVYTGTPYSATAFVQNSTNFGIWIPSVGGIVGSSTASLGSTVLYNASLRVPLLNASVNSVQQNAGQFSMASYIANGTRVTGAAPTQLGQYRSYLRNASANTFTETNGNPTTVPSAANGMFIYANTAWATVNPANSPTKYDIFVGKNKQVSFLFFSAAGMSGNVDATPSQFAATKLIGYARSYDPTTGVATVVAPANSASTTASNTGFDATGAALTTGIYFNILVSDQFVPVQTSPNDSEIYVGSGNGHGSTNTFIRRYTNIIRSVGTAITYADSATLGMTFTINEPGLYSMTKTDGYTAANQYHGISLNSTQLTTSITGITSVNRLAATQVPSSGFGMALSVTRRLNPGDIIRAHDEGTQNNATDLDSNFVITKVSN